MEYLLSSLNSVDKNWQDFLLAKCGNELNFISQQLELFSARQTIFPSINDVFRTLKYPASEQKIVILGQDPYHGIGQANGLAFAVNQDMPIPPSLRNIYKELLLEYPINQYNPFDRTLDNWLKQRVMLLNCTLTVIENQANSMANIGWSGITDAIIQQVSHESSACVFMLWGNFARAKAGLIDSRKHLILEAVHPSPLSASRGFFGCNHFKLANQFLQTKLINPIVWI